MPYSSGTWGKEAKERSQSRREYFRNYRRLHGRQQSVYRYDHKSHGTSLGYKGETIGLKVLSGSKKIMRPCDLSWNGKLVDVKTARPTKALRSVHRWKFLLTKQKNVADLFLLISKDLEDRVVSIHLIPNTEIKGNNISFNENTASKYKKYLLSL